MCRENHRFLPPDDTVPCRASSDGSLVIGSPKHPITEDSEEQDGQRRNPGQIERIVRQILGLEGVHTRDPGGASPSEIKTEVIMGDILR